MRTNSLITIFLFLSAFLMWRNVSLSAEQKQFSGATLQKEIDASYKAGQKKITIPPGVYKFESPEWNRTCLNFLNLQNFEIDATGVTLINPMSNSSTLRFENCKNVTLRGVTLEHDPLPFSQGKIEAIEDNGASLKIRVAEGFPADLDDEKKFPKTFPMTIFDAHTRGWKRDPSSDMGVKSTQRLGPDLFKFQLGNSITQQSHSTVRPGDLLAWRGYVIPDISIVGCAAMKVIGVTVCSGSGTCIYELNGDGGNYYESCKVTRGPRPPHATEDPLFASNADAFDSTKTRHGPTLENCLFEWTDDDGIDMAGFYGCVQEISDVKLIILYRHGDTFQNGDMVRFRDENGASAGQAVVATVKPVTNYKPKLPPHTKLPQFQNKPGDAYYELTLKQKLSLRPGFIVCDANAVCSGYIIRNCVIRHNRARGMILRNDNGLIEGCTLDGNTLTGIALVPEIEYWDNADYSHYIVIRNNVIRDVNLWHANPSAAIMVAAMLQNRFVPLPGGHRSITIENNTFEGNDGPNLIVTSAEDVSIKGNRFNSPCQHAVTASQRKGAIPVDVLCYFSECRNISLSQNSVRKPGPGLKQLVGTSGVVEIKGLPGGLAIGMTNSTKKDSLP
jgi:Right handed beta helix region